MQARPGKAPAGIYFLVDAAIWMLAKPVIRWLADHWVKRRQLPT